MTAQGEGEIRKPRAREDVVFRSVAGDWVLYDPRTQDLHVLNATAAAVWVCCDGTLTMDEMAQEVAEHLEGAPSPEVVRADVNRAVQGFRDVGLLQ